MATHFHIMPVDQTTIKTRLRIHPGLLKDPNGYIKKRKLKVRAVSDYVSAHHRILAFDVRTYKGIKIKLRQDKRSAELDATIGFNPGACLYAHNGSVLSLDEFFDALGVLVTHLRPLLKHPADWVDLIPGVRTGGVAYWSYLELLQHYRDPDGKLLAGFRSAQRVSSNTPIRQWPHSMQISRQDSNLQFVIYRKAAQMVELGKLPRERLPDYWHILRLEVRMKEEKLVRYLGNECNIEEIDGEKRIVRFFPQDLVCGHRTSFSELRGVFAALEPQEALNPGDQLAPLGRLLARVAIQVPLQEQLPPPLQEPLRPHTPHTFPELLAHVRFYTGASTDTISKIRKAGLEELSRLSTIRKDELFSDAAYQAQPGIASDKREARILHEPENLFRHPRIFATYRPPGQPFQPKTQFRSYEKI